MVGEKVVGERMVGEKVAEERMTGEKICIKVILPLKLGWEPCYYAPEEVRRGDRVSVHFSGRQYVGVVSEVRVRPQTDASRIKEIDCVEQGLARVREEELRLWSFMAEYYLCTVGEVYKAAYPLGKLAEERAAVRAARRHEEIAERRRAEAKARSERMEVRLKERLSKKQAALAKARKDSVKEALRDDISKIDRELRAVQAFLSTGYAEQNATASQTRTHGDKQGDQKDQTQTIGTRQSIPAGKAQSLGTQQSTPTSPTQTIGTRQSIPAGQAQSLGTQQSTPTSPTQTLGTRKNAAGGQTQNFRTQQNVSTYPAQPHDSELTGKGTTGGEIKEEEMPGRELKDERTGMTEREHEASPGGELEDGAKGTTGWRPNVARIREQGNEAEDAPEREPRETPDGELKDEAGGATGREIKEQPERMPERGLKDKPTGMSERAPKEMPESELKGVTAGGNGSRRVVLTPAQERAKREIEEGLAEGKPVLLNGVAGSGKTEIYIQLAQETLSRGKNVLYLSPEIALSGQLEERLREVFGSTLICFHSALTPAKRQEATARVREGSQIILDTPSSLPTGKRQEATAQVREGGQIILGTHSALTPAKRQEAAARVREGSQIILDAPSALTPAKRQGATARVREGSQITLDTPSALPTEKRQEAAAQVREGGYIVLGTRSALFLPHHDLGLIVVDEEHDSSYKQDSPAPRYQGRDTAVMMGTIHGAGVLLGSATPSMESLHNCATGRYRMVELSERYFAGSDARLVVIDTLAERRKRGMVGNFSRKLIEEMKKALSEGGQVALLRSRRAYSPLVQCEECGDIPKCVHCNVSLSYHRASARLLCHHCGYSVPYTGVCGKCGGPLKALGTGTQKIEEEVRDLFPEARVARLDADSDVGSVVTDFKERRTDILVGTQVLTKGFDFEGLSLVAVLLADSITGQQDFRSDERALQTFSQFRGRCSRRGRPGTFVVQTSQPDHPVYSLLRGSGESPEIMQRMLDERRDFGYPPFTRLVRIVLKDRSEPRLENLSLKLADTLVNTLGIPANHPSFQLAGPFSPPVDKISDEYIRHIRIHLPRDRSLSRRKETIALAVRDFEAEHSWQGHVSIDVDPL